MKLKRLIASAFAAAALVASVAAPMAVAQDTTSVGQPTESTVNEVGDFTFSLWGPAIAFTPADVSSTQSQDVILAWPSPGPHRVFMVNDNHSYNPNPYSLSITATDLTIASTPYFIDNSNLSVKNVGGGPHSSCLYPYAPYNTEVGGNPYQTVTIHPFSGYVALSSQVGIVDGSAGRGCRAFQINLDFKLHVPAGTYTGGGSATYTGTVTITNTLAP